MSVRVARFSQQNPASCYSKRAQWRFEEGPPLKIAFGEVKYKFFGGVPLVKFTFQKLNITLLGSLQPAATVLKYLNFAGKPRTWQHWCKSKSTHSKSRAQSLVWTQFSAIGWRLRKAWSNLGCVCRGRCPSDTPLAALPANSGAAEGSVARSRVLRPFSSESSRALERSARILGILFSRMRIRCIFTSSESDLTVHWLR